MGDLEKRNAPYSISSSSPTPSTKFHGSVLENAAMGCTDDTKPVFDATQVVCPAYTTEKKLLAQIDLRVIPFLAILYLLAFLDRVNIANAKSFGLLKDLNMDQTPGEGMQYNIALTIFFVPYIIFEIPSNVLLKKYSPRIWLSSCMFLFGFVSICQGLVTSYAGLLTTRFFLGLAEAGLFPGCFYLIGMWYKRSEAQRRYSFFFSSTTLAGAFGGLFATALSNMAGLRGYSGWRWIFIIEGLLTCIVACAFFFLLPSFPEDATWLPLDSRTYVKARLQIDQGASAAERSLTIHDVLDVFKDYKIYLGGFMYFGLIVPAYGFAFFAPTIIATFGYDAVHTQLYSVAPWACAFVFCMLIAYLSDHFKHRFLFAVIPMFVAAAGFIILLIVHDNVHVEYAALFLITMGTYSALPVTVCWFNMNLGGHARRAVGSAWQIAFGNVGGIVATFAFLERDKGSFYRNGYAICLGFLAFGVVSCTVYAGCVGWENRRRERIVGEEGGRGSIEDRGDLSLDYRYLL